MRATAVPVRRCDVAGRQDAAARVAPLLSCWAEVSLATSRGLLLRRTNPVLISASIFLFLTFARRYIGKSPTFSKKPLPTRLPQPCSATSTRALDVTLCQALQSRPLIDPDLLVCCPHACSCSHHNRSFRRRTFPHPGFLSLPGGISLSKLVRVSRFICSMLPCGFDRSIVSFLSQARQAI